MWKRKLKSHYIIGNKYHMYSTLWSLGIVWVESVRSTMSRQKETNKLIYPKDIFFLNFLKYKIKYLKWSFIHLNNKISWFTVFVVLFNAVNSVAWHFNACYFIAHFYNPKIVARHLIKISMSPSLDNSVKCFF